jgi:rod shape-determining protein MreB
VSEEPTVLAARGGEMVAVGSEAREMLGRSPSGLRVTEPIQGGVIADFDAAEQLLHALLRRTMPRALLRPRMVVCVPAETTEVERRAVQDSARSAGAREVTLVAAPLAAALGAALPVHEPVGSLIIDVGAGLTEVAVISLGGMVVHQSVRVAGDAMDDAIVHYLRSRKNLVISEQAARQLKHDLACANVPDRPRTAPGPSRSRWRASAMRCSTCSPAPLRSSLRTSWSEVPSCVAARAGFPASTVYFATPLGCPSCRPSTPCVAPPWERGACSTTRPSSSV